MKKWGGEAKHILGLLHKSGMILSEPAAAKSFSVLHCAQNSDSESLINSDLVRCLQTQILFDINNFWINCRILVPFGVLTFLKKLKSTQFSLCGSSVLKLGV